MSLAGKAAAPAARLRAAETVASRENRWLKQFRATLRGGETLADGSIGVEGARLVEESLRSGLHVEAVLVSASGDRHLARLTPWLGGSVHLLRTSDKLFAGVADTQTPQGVAALLRPRAASFDDILGGGAAVAPLVVVLVGVQDPGNVGTILRAAEAFAASGACACAHGEAGTANPFAPKALRASAGSALRLPVLRGVAVSILLAQLRIAGVKLYAASPGAGAPVTGRAAATRENSHAQPTLDPWQADLRCPAALLVGNEGSGLPGDVERSADALVRIPLAVGVESLNAAMAATVLLYEAARQRGTLT